MFQKIDSNVERPTHRLSAEQVRVAGSASNPDQVQLILLAVGLPLSSSRDTGISHPRGHPSSA